MAADHYIMDTDMKTVADSIRAKTGTSGPLVFPDGMKNAIDGIPTGIGAPKPFKLRINKLKYTGSTEYFTYSKKTTDDTSTVVPIFLFGKNAKLANFEGIFIDTNSPSIAGELIEGDMKDIEMSISRDTYNKMFNDKTHTGPHSLYIQFLKQYSDDESDIVGSVGSMYFYFNPGQYVKWAIFNRMIAVKTGLNAPVDLDLYMSYRANEPYRESPPSDAKDVLIYD